MIIEHDMTVDELLIRIAFGEKYFYRIDFGEGEVENKNFDNIAFDECIMSIKFLDSTLCSTKLINSNIKCCIFDNCNLTNMVIENCSVEGMMFKEAILDGVNFKNNYCYNKVLKNDDMSQFIY